MRLTFKVKESNDHLVHLHSLLKHIESFGLERIPKGHLVQQPCTEQGHLH